jgi:hypothetical protein
MPTAEARIDTERPSRYLVQFCKHAAAMGAARGHGPGAHLRGLLARRDMRVQAEWSDTHGTVTFDPWGTCTVDVGANVLALRIDATDDESLNRIQDVITRDFARFGRRDRLTVRWHLLDAPGTGPAA